MRKGGKKSGSLTPEECVARATEYIEAHGVCLFVVDIVNSRAHFHEFYSPESPWRKLSRLVEEADKRFPEYLPKNRLAVGVREEQGFSFGVGDARWAGINSPEFIPKFLKLHQELYPELQLHYGVAVDGWHEGMALVR